MSLSRAVTRPRNGDYPPPRSVRVANEVWDRAKERATREGHTMSYVLSLFIQGYAEGQVNLPLVVRDYSEVEES